MDAGLKLASCWSEAVNLRPVLQNCPDVHMAAKQLSERGTDAVVVTYTFQRPPPSKANFRRHFDSCYLKMAYQLQQSSSVGKVIDQLVSPDQALYDGVKSDMADNGAPPWRFSLHHLDSVKSMQEDLNTLALIATFLSAVQAQVISYSFDSNSTKLDVTVNALFFVGLLLDILGGCVAYVVAVQLQHIYSLLSRRQSSISQITNVLKQYRPPSGDDTLMTKETQGKMFSICRHIKLLEDSLLGGFNKKSAWKKTLPKVKQCRNSIQEITRLLDEELSVQLYMELQEYQDTTNELDKARLHMNIAFSSIFVIRAVVFWGVVCLVVGLLCYVVGEQPAGVWIAFLTTLGGFTGLFGWIVVWSSLQ